VLAINISAAIKIDKETSVDDITSTIEKDVKDIEVHTKILGSEATTSIIKLIVLDHHNNLLFLKLEDIITILIIGNINFNIYLSG